MWYRVRRAASILVYVEPNNTPLNLQNHDCIIKICTCVCVWVCVCVPKCPIAFTNLPLSAMCLKCEKMIWLCTRTRTHSHQRSWSLSTTANLYLVSIITWTYFVLYTLHYNDAFSDNVHYFPSTFCAWLICCEESSIKCWHRKEIRIVRRAKCSLFT